MDQHIPNQAALNAQAAFMQSWKNDVANRLKAKELFNINIPEGLSPAWQAFFDKVSAYHERQSATTRHALILLENRSRIMEEGGLSEFEMLTSALDMKDKASESRRNSRERLG
jgi:hypothetical protein